MKGLLVVFCSVFIAELGDKTQVATLFFATDQNLNRTGVFMASSAALVCSSLLAVLLACKQEQLSAGGAQVATSQSAPVDSGWEPSSCKSLGYLVGRGGGSFGGALIALFALERLLRAPLPVEPAGEPTTPRDARPEPER